MIGKIIIMVIFMLSYFVGKSQELDVNKVDELTKESVKETSWETIKWSKEVCSFFRVTKVNDDENFELRLMVEGSPFSVSKGQDAVFTFENGTSITLKSDNSATTCKGCGGSRGFPGSALGGITIHYKLSNEQRNTLEASLIKKIKVTHSAGNVEFEIKDTFSKNIVKGLKLVD